MFWGCFLYDKKGPYYIWKDEIQAEKKEANTWLEEQNCLLEPIYKANWELETAIRRV